jgi:hypothetical protein
MDLPTAVLLVVLVGLGVFIVIVLEHRLARIRRLHAASRFDGPDSRPDDDAPEGAVQVGTASIEGPSVDTIDLNRADLPPTPAPLATPAPVVSPSAPDAAAPAMGVSVAAILSAPGVAHPPTTRDSLSVAPRRHDLMQGDTELAALFTSEHEPPWLECSFAPNPAFSLVKPLFDRELELLEHAGGPFDKVAFVEQWQRIFAAGLWIRADPEGGHVGQFLLHIHADGTARLRYG